MLLLGLKSKLNAMGGRIEACLYNDGTHSAGSYVIVTSYIQSRIGNDKKYGYLSSR